MSKLEELEKRLAHVEAELRKERAELREERERTEAINTAVLHPAHRGHCASN